MNEVNIHGGIKWQSPSNIALVKYWGKSPQGLQIPQNPSVSLTLKNCRTETSVFYEESDRFGLHFRFDGKENPEFQTKIANFLKSQMVHFPFLNQMDLHIDSSNTFPHSSGIASSASSMSALVLCLLDIDTSLRGLQEQHGGTKQSTIDLQKASYLARLASGSACRSVFPKAALWGSTDAFSGSSDEYALPLEDTLAPVFKTYHDSILVVSDAKKAVSSRAGHALMDTNPYAETRYAVARQNVAELLSALKTGDLESFIRITEWEAMQLHALMMCSNPSFILMKPNTLRIINTLYEFRRETDSPVCFTLDAGPNVHLLYPDQHAEMVERFIMDELEPYCNEGQWIPDQVGDGPSRC